MNSVIHHVEIVNNMCNSIIMKQEHQVITELNIWVNSSIGPPTIVISQI